MIKIIFIDLDGTLLNDYKEIPEENIKWIKRAYEEKGVISVIATGRPLDFAKIFFEKGNFSADYIIANNGATITNTKTGEFLLKQTMSDDDVLLVRKIFLEEKLDYMMTYSDYGTYIERLKVTKSRDSNNLYNRKDVGNLEKDFLKIYSNSTYMCIIGTYENDLKSTKQKVSKMKNIEPAEICNYLSKASGSEKRSKYIDLNLKGSSKLNAIKVLAKHLNIKKEEIMAIGDGHNDLPMYDIAGIKVAMANAEDALKQKADFVTSSNNDSGVAKAIQKFVF